MTDKFLEISLWTLLFREQETIKCFEVMEEEHSLKPGFTDW